ncbi:MULTISPECIES: hypothetical protein [Streptomyces]|uniref:hypothetical protein n=1 Tax=Streptomyces TaxID=1883 RepID=UPI0004CD4DBA|nr:MULTISPECIES: hypothetical protein [Streptomyces]KOT47131.1 hypothetical protein ADK43_40355 [Streptomyces rimosus subsp. rimosus]
MTALPQLDAALAATTAAGLRSRLYRVAGLDISLTGTGTGIASAGGTVRIPTKDRRKDSIADRHTRLRCIITRVLDEVGTVEGPSHALTGQAGHHAALAGCQWPDLPEVHQ